MARTRSRSGHYLWTKSDSLANAWSVGSCFTGQFTSNAMADFFAGRVGFHRQASENPVKVTQPVAGVLSGLLETRPGHLNYGVVWNPFYP